MSPIIRLQNIHKSYRGLEILRGVDLAIPQGQTVGIVGPSGSGKSTLLRLIMCLERPDRGLLEVESESPWRGDNGERLKRQDMRRLRQVRGKVGMVFQQFNLFPHMTVLRNITEAPVRVRRLPWEQAEAEARKYLQLVDLSDKLHAFPDQLSGGQKQRVAIARALAMHPKILLLDEITSALDPELIGGILHLVKALTDDPDMTVLMVTHHMKFVESCADRILFLDEGHIVEDGSPAEFFHNPISPRARHFLHAIIE